MRTNENGLSVTNISGNLYVNTQNGITTGTNFGRLEGTHHNDTFVGSANDEIFNPMGGSDQIVASDGLDSFIWIPASQASLIINDYENWEEIQFWNESSLGSQ